MAPRYQIPESDWLRHERCCWDETILPNLRREPLRERSIAALRLAYAMWLYHLRQNGAGYRSGPPLASINRELAIRFIADIRDRSSAVSALIQAQRLKRLAAVFDPKADLNWMQDLTSPLLRERGKTPRRPPTTVSSSALLGVGLDLMETAKQRIDVSNPCRTTSGCLLFRDGLIISLLALRPFRLSNLTQLKICENIALRPGAAWIRVRGSDTKNGAEIDVPVPQQLLDCFVTYVEHIRRAFPSARRSDALWPSTRGTRLCAGAISHMVAERTRKALGISVSPHGFRHAAVSYLAAEHPEMIGIAPDLLGHLSPRTTEEFYRRDDVCVGAGVVQATLLDEAVQRMAKRLQRQ